MTDMELLERLGQSSNDAVALIAYTVGGLLLEEDEQALFDLAEHCGEIAQRHYSIVTAEDLLSGRERS